MSDFQNRQLSGFGVGVRGSLMPSASTSPPPPGLKEAVRTTHWEAHLSPGGRDGGRKGRPKRDLQAVEGQHPGEEEGGKRNEGRDAGWEG